MEPESLPDIFVGVAHTQDYASPLQGNHRPAGRQIAPTAYH
jgi:hypothetical protein